MCICLLVYQKVVSNIKTVLSESDSQTMWSHKNCPISKAQYKGISWSIMSLSLCSQLLFYVPIYTTIYAFSYLIKGNLCQLPALSCIYNIRLWKCRTFNYDSSDKYDFSEDIHTMNLILSVTRISQCTQWPGMLLVSLYIYQHTFYILQNHNGG